MISHSNPPGIPRARGTFEKAADISSCIKTSIRPSAFEIEKSFPHQGMTDRY
jgi:hypothetical protein